MEDTTLRVAKQVNHLVKEYVSIEEDIFKPSMGKILPIPGIFRPVNYTGHSERLEKMLLELEKSKKDIRSLKPANDSIEGEFLITLRAYINAFSVALSELSIICGKLQLRSQGRAYTGKEYKSDATGLRKLEMVYFDIGKKLNTLFAELSGRNMPEEKE
ncbi:MAG TPA: hypothetical protein PLV56_02365 [Synergistales bacterium]|nr:hypothetical protein [Synergistales bacterium]